MGLFSRRHPPADAVADAGLERGEHVLAWADADSGGTVLATDRGVYLPGRNGTVRIGWEHVDKATWDRDEATLTVAEATPGGRPRRHLVRLEDPGDLVLVVRQRVHAAVVISRHVPVDGKRGVTVIGRRPPGSDVLTWTAALDGGLDVSDAETKRRVDEAVREVQRDVGL